MNKHLAINPKMCVRSIMGCLGCWMEMGVAVSDVGPGICLGWPTYPSTHRQIAVEY